MSGRNGSLGWAWRMLRVLVPLNLVWGVLIALMLVASLLKEDLVMTALTSGNATARMTAGMRGIMVLGIVTVLPVNVVLTRLRAIVYSVRRGDPFTAGNAARLRVIAWALVMMEALHLAIGLLAHFASSETVSLDIGWAPSISRWLAVLLLFVLAHVFEQGAAMRADLEGTI